MDARVKRDRMSGPDPIDVYVGSRIRMRRTMLAMSQEKLADQLGITFQQVQKYENGANRVGASRLFAICKILGVSVSFFFEGYQEEVEAAKERVAEGGLDIDKFLNSKETVELIRAYYAIEDKSVRKKVFEMLKSLTQISA